MVNEFTSSCTCIVVCVVTYPVYDFNSHILDMITDRPAYTTLKTELVSMKTSQEKKNHYFAENFKVTCETNHSLLIMYLTNT